MFARPFQIENCSKRSILDCLKPGFASVQSLDSVLVASYWFEVNLQNCLVIRNKNESEFYRGSPGEKFKSESLQLFGNLKYLSVVVR